MNKSQENNIKNLQSNFDTLWYKFANLLPIVEDIISKKNLLKFKKSFLAKYENLCDANLEIIYSNCLLERYVCSLTSNVLGTEFKDEINGICTVVSKALEYSRGNDLIQKGLKDIIRNMILTIDVNPDNPNNDYRNRLNEILFFNWLSECENIEILSIEKQLGNGKSCDFECRHNDGTIILFEVLSINNLEIIKQDNSQTFSDFIGEKVKDKFMDKTKNLFSLPNIIIIPILEYKEGLEDFKITLNYEFSTQPYTVIKNVNESMNEIFLGNLDEISEYICNQKNHNQL